MKIRVNKEACIGCGACTSIAEELFQINDEGVSEAKVEEVAAELSEKATEAIDSY